MGSEKKGKRRYRLGVLAALVVAMSLTAGSPASAATEFGDNCVADSAASEFTLFQIASKSALPQAAPSDGVITEWKVSVVPAAPPLAHNLKVVRVTGASTAQVVGESASQSVVSGFNSFDARIPVQKGDRLGLFGSNPTGTLFCESVDPEDVVGATTEPTPLGGTFNFAQFSGEARIPVAAILEPDADKDGFGDESQDKCPQNTVIQGDCAPSPPPPPPSPAVASVSVDLSLLAKRKSAVVVLVTTSSTAPVTVSGVVNLGKKKKGKGEAKNARKNAQARLNGGTKTAAPGTITRFVLRFTKSLQKRLKQLPGKRSLKLRVAATARDSIGRVTSDNLKVQLKGQAKPRRKGKAGSKRGR